MNKKLSHQQQQEQVTGHQSALKAGHEFASPEEMLRHDAAQTTVPPAIADRLQYSLSQTKAPARSWWKLLFGG
jgi:hypothetical protein